MDIKSKLWGNRNVLRFNKYSEINFNINSIFVIYNELNEKEIDEFLYYEIDHRRDDVEESKQGTIEYHSDLDRINKNRENRKFYEIGKKTYEEKFLKLEGSECSLIIKNIYNVYKEEYPRFVKRENRNTGNLINPLNLLRKNTSSIDHYLSFYLETDSSDDEFGLFSWNPPDEDKLDWGKTLEGGIFSYDQDYSTMMNNDMNKVQGYIRDYGMIFKNGNCDLSVIESKNFNSVLFK